jgi:hypothetical protein
MRVAVIIGLILVMVFAFSGCAQFQRSAVIDTDQLSGYASGTYKENSQGTNGTLSIGGAGSSWGGGGAFGGGYVYLHTGPPKSGTYDFARSIAMINYSKKLKKITYDEYGGVIDYEFEDGPVASAAQGSVKKPKLPSAFGHQPIE